MPKSPNYYEEHQLRKHLLLEEENWLLSLLKTTERELSHAPKGSLSITKKGNKTWYYQRYTTPGAKPIYLNRKREHTIYALAQKKYDLQLKKVIEKELAQIQREKALSYSDLAAVYESFPESWKPFIVPHVLPDQLFEQEWLQQYSSTSSGDTFKSKAEYICNGIYQKLDAPHVYEPRLYLVGYGSIRPDFVVLNRRTRQTFYHEHFGMMDSPEYCKQALAKLEDYHRNGFYEGINLIITMESSLHPMNPEEVEDILRKHVL